MPNRSFRVKKILKTTIKTLTWTNIQMKRILIYIKQPHRNQLNKFKNSKKILTKLTNKIPTLKKYPHIILKNSKTTKKALNNILTTTKKCNKTQKITHQTTLLVIQYNLKIKKKGLLTNSKVGQYTMGNGLATTEKVSEFKHGKMELDMKVKYA